MKPDLTKLSPKDLFYTQREAYLNGDMEAVREMGAIAKARLTLPNQEDWEEAKKTLDEMDFPSKNDRNWKELKFNLTHPFKKETHNLTTYKIWGNILLFPYEACMVECKECAQIRNASFTLFNNKRAIVHEKWFVFHGKDTHGKDIFKLAQEIFAVFLIAFAL